MSKSIKLTTSTKIKAILCESVIRTFAGILCTFMVAVNFAGFSGNHGNDTVYWLYLNHGFDYWGIFLISGVCLLMLFTMVPLNILVRDFVRDKLNLKFMKKRNKQDEINTTFISSFYFAIFAPFIFFDNPDNYFLFVYILFVYIFVLALLLIECIEIKINNIVRYTTEIKQTLVVLSLYIIISYQFSLWEFVSNVFLLNSIAT